MIHSAPRVRLLAAGLAALAGFVDAVGFLQLGGRFVSFMSGNSTRLAVEGARGAATAWIAGGLIILFVAGVVIGSLAGGWAGARRRPVVLLVVAVTLGIAAALADAGLSALAAAAMVVAMGAENAVFERDGEVAIGLTYMTGTLVRVGQRLTLALRGGARFGWVPHLMLWLGLVGGAVAGARVFAHLGLDALWLAAGAALVFAALATRA